MTNSLSDHKAVILAGGKGTRLYPITREIPKPLLPIQKKPIINYLVDLFRKHGIHQIAVLVSSEFTEDFHWWNKRYYPDQEILIVEEKEPLGTFGGIGLLKEWIGDCSFFLTNGDELKDVDLGAIAQYHRGSEALATIALVEVERPQEYGVVLCDAQGRVTQFIEKPAHPPSRFISSGLYLCSPKILDFVPVAQFCMIEKDIFPKLAQEGKLAGFQFRGKWTDCGTWERYEKAIQEWA